MPNAWEAAPVVNPAPSAPAWSSAPLVSAPPAPETEPRKAFGTLFDDPKAPNKPGTVSMPDYLIDQVDRGPFKLFDFIHHGMNAQMPFEDWPKPMQKEWLAANGKPPDPERHPGAELAEKLLGPEPQASGFWQGVGGAGAAAATSGGMGGVGWLSKLKSMATSGVFGATQESVSRGLQAMGMSREHADALTLALGIGATIGTSKVAGSVGKDAAEKKALAETADLTAHRDALEPGRGSAEDVQAAARAQAALAEAGRDKADAAATAIAKRQTDDTIAKHIEAFQPGTALETQAQGTLQKFQDTVRQKAEAAAQGTLQNEVFGKKADISDAITEAEKLAEKFKGRPGMSGPANAVRSELESLIPKEDKPVIVDAQGRPMRQGAADTRVDTETVHNAINELTDRINGVGTYKAEHTPAMRNLISIRDKLIEAQDAVTGGAYTKYREKYAEGMAPLDVFQSGQKLNKVTDRLDYDRINAMGGREAADSLLAKGPRGGDLAERVQSVMKDNPGFQQAMQSHVGQMLSDMKAAGELNPKGFTQFQRDYGPALKQYGLDKKVGTLDGAMKASEQWEKSLTDMRKAHETQRQQYESSALGKAIARGQDPELIGERLLSSPNDRLGNMTEAVRSIQKSGQTEAAMNGLRTQFNRYFFDHPKEADALARTATKSGLYTGEQAEAINKVAKDLAGLEAKRQATRILKDGASNFENMRSLAAYTVHKVGFIAAASTLGTIAGGPATGASMGVASYAMQRAVERQKQMTIDAIAEIVKDPKMAKIMASKPDKGNAFMADHIARNIAADIVRESQNKDEQ